MLGNDFGRVHDSVQTPLHAKLLAPVVRVAPRTRPSSQIPGVPRDIQLGRYCYIRAKQIPSPPLLSEEIGHPAEDHEMKEEDEIQEESIGEEISEGGYDADGEIEDSQEEFGEGGEEMDENEEDVVAVVHVIYYGEVMVVESVPSHEKSSNANVEL